MRESNSLEFLTARGVVVTLCLHGMSYVTRQTVGTGVTRRNGPAQQLSFLRLKTYLGLSFIHMTKLLNLYLPIFK